MSTGSCYLCNESNVTIMPNYANMSSLFVCPCCGPYVLSSDVISKHSIDKNRLASYLFYNRPKRKYDPASIEGLTKYVIVSKDATWVNDADEREGKQHEIYVDDNVVNTWYPRSIAEKTDCILSRLNELMDYEGQDITLSAAEVQSLLFVRRFDEEGNPFDQEALDRQEGFKTVFLKEKAFFHKMHDGNGKGYSYQVALFPEGYRRIDQLQKNNAEGKSVLVAMKFGEDTLTLREAIKAGVRGAGYNPILIDEVEHNGLITPELLSWIKKSRFVVVDLTHMNNGAYFEEGYAMGLGKPVIQLCKKDVKLHFDVAQKNTIMWGTETDIPEKLTNRIKATIG